MNRATLADVLLYQAGMEEGKAEGKAEIARLRAALEAVEWVFSYYESSLGGESSCPWCDAVFDHIRDRGKHAPDCLRQKALGL